MHRFFRFLLPALAIATLAGCAAKSTEERLEDLEAKARDQHLFDLRLSNLEERTSQLEANCEQPREAAAKKQSPPPVTKVRSVAPKPAAFDPLPASPVQLATIDPHTLRSPEQGAAVPPAPPPAQGAPASAPEKADAAAQPVPPPAEKSQPSLTPPKPADPVPREKAQPPKGKNGAQAYEAALALYNKGEYDKSMEAFKSFLDQNPGSPLGPNAVYWQGECLYSLGKYDNAIIYFKDVATKYPKHPKAAASLLKAGYSYERIKDMENARFYWQILVDDFPKSSPAALARQRL